MIKQVLENSNILLKDVLITTPQELEKILAFSKENDCNYLLNIIFIVFFFFILTSFYFSATK